MNSQVNIDVYMQEYTRDDIIAKYISDSAGAGIAYILHHVYAPAYRRAIKELISSRPMGHQFRVMEYGFLFADDRRRASRSIESSSRKPELAIDLCRSGQREPDC